MQEVHHQPLLEPPPELTLKFISWSTTAPEFQTYPGNEALIAAMCCSFT